MSSKVEKEPEPYWLEADIPRRFDIALLRPSSLPKEKRFESRADAKALSEKHESALVHGSTERQADLAEVLSECRKGYACGLPICPLCNRRYRRWFIGQALKLEARDHGTAKTLTVFLAEYAQGELDQADLAKLHAKLRIRLRRAGFAGSMVIGGTEVRYRASDQSWLVHVHLLAIDADQAGILQLKDMSGPDQGGPAVVVEELTDPIDQLSCLQKFATYHRPGRQTSSRRPGAYPIPPTPLRELLVWMAEYQFDDFRFLFGARRRGSRIVRVGS